MTFPTSSASVFATARSGVNSSHKYILGLSGNDFHIFFGSNASEYYANLYGNGAGTWYGGVVPNTPNKDISDKYYVLTGIQDGSSRPYWDGTAQNVRAIGMVGSGATTINIGSSNQNTTQFWEGFMAEVLIYMRVVAEEERIFVQDDMLAYYGL